MIVPTTNSQVRRVVKLMGDRLKLLRKERGIDLKMLARKTGVARAALKRIEEGDAFATLENMDAVCKFYGIKFSDLWEKQRDK